ncbi:MAG: amino acid transporter [Phyllobacteriaceae bacterium]|nr:amino acid transporter [Phyllobacteriaceae bacterium]
MFSAALSGFLLGGSLIVAIGAQNAFVIRQGVIGRHLFWVCLFCSLSDALLIWSGVFGLALLIKSHPGFISVMTYGGATFLLWYGISAFRRALAPAALAVSGAAGGSLLTALSACAAFTFLNPHVYLDTVIFVGSIANARPAGEQWPFAAGASLASFVWFFAIGYGAGALRTWLSRPQVWRAIDLAIAAVMFALAAKLLLG